MNLFEAYEAVGYSQWDPESNFVWFLQKYGLVPDEGRVVAAFGECPEHEPEKRTIAWCHEDGRSGTLLSEDTLARLEAWQVPT